MKQPLTINTLVQVRNAETGDFEAVKLAQWHMMPVDTRDGKCAECAVKHDSEEPHNQQSLAYQYTFYAREARWPTWADAMAHCSPEVKAVWLKALRELGADV